MFGGGLGRKDGHLAESPCIANSCRAGPLAGSAGRGDGPLAVWTSAAQIGGSSGPPFDAQDRGQEAFGDTTTGIPARRLGHLIPPPAAAGSVNSLLRSATIKPLCLERSIHSRTPGKAAFMRR